jgi:hypothetical protein
MFFFTAPLFKCTIGGIDSSPPHVFAISSPPPLCFLFPDDSSCSRHRPRSGYRVLFGHAASAFYVRPPRKLVSLRAHSCCFYVADRSKYFRCRRTSLERPAK